MECVWKCRRPFCLGLKELMIIAWCSEKSVSHFIKKIRVYRSIIPCFITFLCINIQDPAMNCHLRSTNVTYDKHWSFTINHRPLPKSVNTKPTWSVTINMAIFSMASIWHTSAYEIWISMWTIHGPELFPTQTAASWDTSPLIDWTV